MSGAFDVLLAHITVRDERIAELEARVAKLESLIMNWYIAPPDSGFSEETLALQDEAKQLVDSLPLPKFGG